MEFLSCHALGQSCSLFLQQTQTARRTLTKAACGFWTNAARVQGAGAGKGPGLPLLPSPAMGLLMKALFSLRTEG